MSDIELTLPRDGANPYAEHPGFTATDCEFRLTVTGKNSGAISGGFACSASGGHCLPDEGYCQIRKDNVAIQDKLQALIMEGTGV